MKRHGRDKVRGNYKKAATMQSTSNVLPSSGPTVREIRTSCEGCTTNNRLGFEMYQRKSLLVMVGAVAATPKKCVDGSGVFHVCFDFLGSQD